VHDTTDVDKCFMDYLQPKKGESSENTEKQFLLSLLPYMSEMNV
jgi:hypothetical protein